MSCTAHDRVLIASAVVCAAHYNSDGFSHSPHCCYCGHSPLLSPPWAGCDMRDRAHVSRCGQVQWSSQAPVTSYLDIRSRE